MESALKHNHCDQIQVQHKQGIVFCMPLSRLCCVKLYLICGFAPGKKRKDRTLCHLPGQVVLNGPEHRHNASILSGDDCIPGDLTWRVLTTPLQLGNGCHVLHRGRHRGHVPKSTLIMMSRKSPAALKAIYTAPAGTYNGSSNGGGEKERIQLYCGNRHI